MSNDIESDAAAQPELFLWKGPVRREELHEYLSRAGYRIPEDLQRFWSLTGGGDLFETETILKIHGDPRLGDDLVERNLQLREGGLPDGLVVFHTGLGLSAVRESDGRYLWLDPQSFQVISACGSLNEWYRSILRPEYAARYGLESN